MTKDLKPIASAPTNHEILACSGDGWFIVKKHDDGKFYDDVSGEIIGEENGWCDLLYWMHCPALPEEIFN